MEREFMPVDDFFKTSKNPPHDVLIMLYHKNKGKRKTSMKKAKKKYTLNQIGEMVLSLGTRMDGLEARMDRLETHMDRLETRLGRVEKRLDYNGLKDLPKDR